MNKFIDILKLIVGWSTIVVLFLFVVLFLYWNFQNYNVIEFKHPYKTEKTVYNQGDKTFYKVDYCKNMNVPATIRKEFVDGLIFTAVSPQAQLTLGCREQSVPLDIPDSLPKGRYRLRNTITYQVNPVRTVQYVHYSNWFTVKEKE